MNHYFNELLSFIVKNPKAFLYHFLKKNISYNLAIKLIQQNIHISFLENEEYYRIDLFIPYQNKIFDIQFSNTDLWRNTTDKFLKNFENNYQNLIIFSYKIQSLKDVEKIKRNKKFLK